MNEPASRRAFIRQTATAAACAWAATAGLGAMQAGQTGRRRQVRVSGRRVTTVDVHAHTAVPAALTDIVRATSLENAVRGQLAGNLVMNDTRLRAMDEQGIDVEVLTINAFWYGADRELAAKVI